MSLRRLCLSNKNLAGNVMNYSGNDGPGNVFADAVRLLNGWCWSFMEAQVLLLTVL